MQPPEKDLRTRLDKLRDMATMGEPGEREVAAALLERLEAREAANPRPNPMSAPPRTKSGPVTFSFATSSSRPPRYTSAFQMFAAGIRPRPVSDEEMRELFARIFGAGVTPPDGTKVWTFDYFSGDKDDDDDP